MKYYRYMSFAEYEKLMAGEKLVSHNEHADKRTTGFGFCFLGEDSNGYEPYEALDFLYGIVSDDVLVEFTTDLQLQACRATYSNPMGEFWETMEITEYCTSAYNISTMAPTLVMYCPDLINLSEWERPSMAGLKSAEAQKGAKELEQKSEQLLAELQQLSRQLSQTAI